MYVLCVMYVYMCYVFIMYVLCIVYCYYIMYVLFIVYCYGSFMCYVCVMCFVLYMFYGLCMCYVFCVMYLFCVGCYVCVESKSDLRPPPRNRPLIMDFLACVILGFGYSEHSQCGRFLWGSAGQI